MSAAGIFASIEESKLEREFEKAANDPKGLECGFVEQRCGSGLANFGVKPDVAALMREKNLSRIAAELEAEKPEYDEGDDDLGLDDDDLDDDFGDLPPLDDKDDEFDRFSDSVDLPDLDDNVDNWE